MALRRAPSGTGTGAVLPIGGFADVIHIGGSGLMGRAGFEFGVRRFSELVMVRDF